MSAGGLQLILQDRHNTLALWRNVFFQFRRGDLTLQALDTIVAAVRSARVGQKGAMAAVLVNHPTATVPSQEVLDKQRVVVRELLEDQRSHAFVVVLGDGVGAMMRRTVIRASLAGKDRMRLFASVDDAVRAAAGVTQQDADALLAVARELLSS